MVNTSEMKWTSAVIVFIAFLFLTYGTVAVFLAFDRVSHSNSDTLRPFIITMVPVWGVAIWAAITLLRRPYR